MGVTYKLQRLQQVQNSAIHWELWQQTDSSPISAYPHQGVFNNITEIDQSAVKLTFIVYF